MNEEKIAIFADPDYDGISSFCLLYKYLLNFTENLVEITSERSGGHGSQGAIHQIPDDTKLYIAVDSSSNDVEEMKFLTSKGIDCLIIDHHTVTSDNTYAILVNPQQEGCQYPNKNSCGGLLVYKVCQVIDDYMNTSFAEQYDDLPGFALLADIMSMREMENRYYAKKSLTELRHAGIRELFKAMNFDLNNLSSTDFLYGVSPAITAATRADNISLAIDLLMCDEPCGEISCLVKNLIQTNEERKIIQAEALNRLKSTVDDSNKVIIAYDPSVGKGYNGLVSQELSKHFNRPSIVLGDGEEPNTYAGSFRGLEDFSMLDLLNSCDNALFAAGHDAAGGVRLYHSNLSLLQDELNQRLADFKPDETEYYELEFDIHDINEKLINKINDFYRVSGNGFKPGKFLIRGLFVEDKKLMGKSSNTVRIDCGQIKLMKFKTDEEFYDNVPIFSEIEAIGTLNVNEWKVYKPRFKIVKTNQLFIDDYRVVN